MRLPRRGVLIRLFIYIPLIGYLGWRAYDSRCGEPATVQPESPSVEDRLAPHRRVITLPDGRKQEIVELTPEEAEAILGRPLPQHMKDDATEPPGTAPANTPANTPGTVPANTPGTVPANTPGTVPANTPGTAPANTPGTAPANAPGTAPANAPAEGAAEARSKPVSGSSGPSTEGAAAKAPAD